MATPNSQPPDPALRESSAVRSSLVEALELALVGPSNDHRFSGELLRQSPRKTYLTGFLVPADGSAKHRVAEDPALTGEIEDLEPKVRGTDDDSTPDKAATAAQFLPSSIGLSCLVSGGVEVIQAVVQWGDYHWESPAVGEEPEDDEEEPPENPSVRTSENTGEDGPGYSVAPYSPKGYRRDAREERVRIPVPGDTSKYTYPVPNSGGLELVVSCRSVDSGAVGLPQGTRSLSVFLVNRRNANGKGYQVAVFQATLILECAVGFAGRPDLRRGGDGSASDADEDIADIHYRDDLEYAVGHGVSAMPDAPEAGGKVVRVRSTWIPSAEVERVEPASLPGVELGMENLGGLADGHAAKAALGPMVTAYRDWLDDQQAMMAGLGLSSTRSATANRMLADAKVAANRMEAGIACLADPDVLDAFRIANRAVAAAARQRLGIVAPAWRPFQIAFILLNLPGVVNPAHDDRLKVDLLFFPTGGGKTEAYLGLAAFTMVLRRLKNSGGLGGCGVSVLMRYTLRLLTLDQLGRAAGLICAMELEREKNPERYGQWPFEVGLWVGSAATPNRMGGPGYSGPGKDHTAYIKTFRYKKNSKSNPAPIPLESCPWCGTKFDADSFDLVPPGKNPKDLRVHCLNHACEFNGTHRLLPIVTVDEPIYRRLPAFLIATVDKFAALPWTGETGALFGGVQNHDKDGFYGPCHSGAGKPLPDGALPPADLIIQDELHLISGPLGTIAGVYETAIEALMIRNADGKVARPKIIASTATVRRAERQIRALFGRNETAIFPPPGLDRRNSFFAVTRPSTEVPARLYVGVAAQGRSLKVVLMRVALALLSAGLSLYERAGGRMPGRNNPADPYMTMLGYFNSLRELGGSRRIIEDEVRSRLEDYHKQNRLDPVDHTFTRRTIQYDAPELTSRVSTNAVSEVKHRLGRNHDEADYVDVALATNMISVGLDITRLGLMVVLGQPKTSSEYIQATSRVGRDKEKPGLVVTLLNIHKPRDRSHYESFRHYHTTFYRAVEATSVTPFSPRALDRALSAALVGLCRHAFPAMTPPTGASEIKNTRNAMGGAAKIFSDRAAGHDRQLTPQQASLLAAGVLDRVNRLLDDWLKIQQALEKQGTTLQYQRELKAAATALLHDFLDPELGNLDPIFRKFRANRSMRDVESSVALLAKPLNEL